MQNPDAVRMEDRGVSSRAEVPLPLSPVAMVIQSICACPRTCVPRVPPPPAPGLVAGPKGCKVTVQEKEKKLFGYTGDKSPMLFFWSGRPSGFLECITLLAARNRCFQTSH